MRRDVQDAPDPGATAQAMLFFGRMAAAETVLDPIFMAVLPGRGGAKRAMATVCHHVMMLAWAATHRMLLVHSVHSVHPAAHEACMLIALISAHRSVVYWNAAVRQWSPEARAPPLIVATTCILQFGGAMLVSLARLLACPCDAPAVVAIDVAQALCVCVLAAIPSVAMLRKWAVVLVCRHDASHTVYRPIWVPKRATPFHLSTE